MNAPLKVTLDTNCVINMFDHTSTTATSLDELATLVRYGLSGTIEIAVTTRTEADLSNDRDSVRRDEMLRTLQMLPVVGTVGRWGTSRWGEGDVWVGKNQERLLEDIKGIVFPGLLESDRRFRNKINDIDHLVGHLLNRRDIFVTDDKDMLRRKDALKRGPGLVIMTPAECVAYVDAIELRKTPQTFPSESLNPAYHSPALRGQVAFDYSNNDHQYALGEGHFFFETRWSKASNKAIYAYTDSPSISALALAKGAAEIANIADCATYDFSSRVRMPNVGEIVIWRNVNGLYAATKILDIKDDDRGDVNDELTFEYAILSDGSTSFAANGRTTV